MVSQKRVAIYPRVSIVDKGQDPETQLMALREYAECRGFQIGGEYIDYTTSARKIDPNSEYYGKQLASGESMLSWSGVTSGFPAQHKRWWKP